MFIELSFEVGVLGEGVLLWSVFVEFVGEGVQEGELVLGFESLIVCVDGVGDAEVKVVVGQSLGGTVVDGVNSCGEI